MSTSKKDVTSRFLRTVPIVLVCVLVLIGIAALQQPHLGRALARDWPFALLVFIVAALTNALPRRWPLVGSLVVLIASAFLATFTEFTPVGFICLAIAGFFFGMIVMSLLYTIKARRTGQSTSGSGKKG